MGKVALRSGSMSLIRGESGEGLRSDPSRLTSVMRVISTEQDMLAQKEADYHPQDLLPCA